MPAGPVLVRAAGHTVYCCCCWLLLLLLLWCTWQHEDAAPRHLARDEDGGEEEPHARPRPRPGSLLPPVLGDLLILGHDDNTIRAQLRGVGWSAWKQLLVKPSLR